MGLAKMSSREPTPYLGSRTFKRDGVEVDLDTQRLRIVNHCFQPDQEIWEDEEVEINGTTVTIAKWTVIPRCPSRKEACEIYRDHIYMGLDPALLPCCGAPVPGEADEDRVFDEIDLIADIGDVLRSEEAYPVYETEREKEGIA